MKKYTPDEIIEEIKETLKNSDNGDSDWDEGWDDARECIIEHFQELKKENRCDLCKKELKDNESGNNPYPLQGEKCCNECNDCLVVPTRLRLNQMLMSNTTKSEEVKQK